MSDCLFCKIVAGEIPAKIVAESDHALAFDDIAPQAPVHALVIPKEHFESVNALAHSDRDIYAEMLSLVDTVVTHEGVRESGYRLVVNVGEDGLMTVGHLHLHVLGGRRMNWPPG